MIKFLPYVLVFCMAARAFSATYYIDFDSGNDASAGTSTGTAWKSLPGTQDAASTGDLSSSYGGGTFTTSSKVPAGTIFKIKSGTTWNSTDGGRWNITSSWYDNGASANPILIQLDTGWGSGGTLVDGTGMVVPIALCLVQRDGVIIDGVITNGLMFANSTNRGVYYKEQAGTSVSLLDVGVRFLCLSNNSTLAASDSAGSGRGYLQFPRATGVTVSNVVMIGNNNWGCGLILGEAGMGVTNAVIANSVATGLQGDTSANDSGIGFKAFNSSFLLINSIATNNLKGCDFGEQNGAGSNIFYRVVNCTLASNMWGIASSDKSGPRAGTHTNLLLNCLVYSNQYNGVWNYGGPFTSIEVHNTMYGNGASSNFNSASIRLGNDNAERETVTCYIYNNIFYKPAGRGNFNNHQFDQDIDSDGFSLDSDYNSWIARAGENFGYWAGAEGAPDNQTYTYGANGPGHASGNWYAFYSYSATGPTNGATGHFHCDAHSYATSGDVTTEPPFAADYTLTTHYPGLNISTKPWYLPEMGLDRNGATRTSWDLGAYEYVPTGPVATPGGVRGSARLSGGSTLR